MSKELIGNQTFGQIYENYKQSPAGQILSQRTRWNRFRPENISNETWIQTLSLDADNLRHCLVIYGITDWFISQQNNSDMPIKFFGKEKNLLLLTALSHDIPEGMTAKGDISLEYKTDQDEQEELALIKKAVIGVLDESCDRHQIATEVKNCLEDKTSKLGHAFSAIENIGYIRTALIAWKNNDRSNPILAANLKLITNNVLINSIPKLTEFSKIYFPIKKYLQDRSNIITKAFNMETSYFDAYGPDTKDIYYQKFLSTKPIWEKWIQQNIRC
jgi:hypothetical protein